MCMCHSDNNGVTNVVSKVRLPETVVPEHYELLLRPDLTKFTFSGDEVIDVRVKEPVSQIIINSAEMTISDAYVLDAAGTRHNGTVTLDEENERAVIDFGGTVGKGKWKLHLSFAGILNNKLHGFYRSTYKDSTGKEHVIASTQFEPNDARRAFPCFDEPAFKATFGVTLEVDEHLTAISNGPIVSETLVEKDKELSIDYGNGMKYVARPQRNVKVVRFGKTMKMSTYIVAFVIGEFEHTDPIVVNGTAVRVFHIPGKSELATFALKAAQFSLTWYERYFGIKYPGDKLDLIGIPDFAFGAMENLGCVTFRETALLVNEKTGTIAEMERVAEVVAHEIAHMWFGDLVTMKWWNGLWLNEAFATFMATKVEAAFRPEWQRWNSFAIERAAAFRTDGLAATRPIEAPVEHPAQALGMIDVITYRKGCSVLRQLEQFLGEDNFRNGIRVYLKKHSYSNATGDDLWSAIESVNPSVPVVKIMNSWIFQPGYPVISVSESAIAGGVTLKQSRFRYLPSMATHEQYWLAPVCLRFKTAEGEQTMWVLLDEGEKSIYLGENVEWVVANAGGNCFHRTLYSPGLAAKITANIGNLSAIERFNLVNDAWACVQAGLQSAPEYLGIVKLFTGETDPNVWSIISGSLSRLHGLLPDAPQDEFEKLVRDIARPTFNRLGWTAKDGENAQDRQVRGTVVSLLGTVGADAEVQAKAKELFNAYKADKTAVASDLVPALVGLVAYTGGATEYAEFQRLAKATNVPQEQVRFLQALARFRDKALLSRTLNATITSDVRTQDAPALVVTLLGNEVISADAWAFVKKNWAHMVANYPETGMISMCSGVVNLDSPELEADVRSWFAANPVKGGDKAVAQHLESLRIGVLFNERETARLTATFTPAAPAAPTA